MEKRPVVRTLCQDQEECAYQPGTVLDLRETSLNELTRETTVVTLAKHLTDQNVDQVWIARPEDDSVSHFHELRGRLQARLDRLCSCEQRPLLKLVLLWPSTNLDECFLLGRKLRILSELMETLPELDDAHPGVATALAATCKGVSDFTRK